MFEFDAVVDHSSQLSKALTREGMLVLDAYSTMQQIVIISFLVTLIPVY